MFVLRSVIYFILLFIVFETVALSAVAWSFYESLQNALKQESLLSDHRARDFTLAIAKVSEVRLNFAGYQELNKTYFRYVEETGKDREKFLLKEIRLYNPDGLLLSSSVDTEVKELVENRKPNIELTKEVYFRKAMRMKKWEWPEDDKEHTKNLKMSFPHLPKYASFLIKFFPLSKAIEARIYAPVYHETKLDVLGAVFVTYERGNLALLLENQFGLLKWMGINYSIIAFILSIILWAVFFLFHYFAKREGSAVGLVAENLISKDRSLPLIQKKTIASETIETREVATIIPSEPVSEIQAVLPPEIQKQPEPVIVPISVSSTDVLDAIFLG